MADIKYLYDKIAQLIEIQGYNEYLERAETLYYEESGNDKHLIIKRDMLNTNYDAVFVYIYGAWQHWGMIIGNPLVISPIYNNGSLLLKSNRIVAHHIGFEGSPANDLSYRILASYQRSWGTYKNPLPEVADNFNFLAEVAWRPRRLPGWEGTLSVGIDAGDLIGRSAGLQLSIAKTGLIRF